MKSQITEHIHCRRCLEELPDGLSAREWQQIEAGFTEKGLQLWCKRHDCNICYIDFEGARHPLDESSTYSHSPTFEEMDIDAFLNLRDWFENALVVQGAKVIDKGIGFGSADIGITIEGMPYGISITPRPLSDGNYSDAKG